MSSVYQRIHDHTRNNITVDKIHERKAADVLVPGGGLDHLTLPKTTSI